MLARSRCGWITCELRHRATRAAGSLERRPVARSAASRRAARLSPCWRRRLATRQAASDRWSRERRRPRSPVPDRRHRNDASGRQRHTLGTRVNEVDPCDAQRPFTRSMLPSGSFRILDGPRSRKEGPDGSDQTLMNAACAPHPCDWITRDTRVSSTVEEEK